MKGIESLTVWPKYFSGENGVGKRDKSQEESCIVKHRCGEATVEIYFPLGPPTTALPAFHWILCISPIQLRRVGAWEGLWARFVQLSFFENKVL